MYRNALFFADRLRSCIWALLPGPATGLPKKGSVIPFAGLALRATDLEVTPQGDLLYVDQRNDVVQRISYLVANQAADRCRNRDSGQRCDAARRDVQRARLDRPGRRRRAHLRVGPRR